MQHVEQILQHLAYIRCGGTEPKDIVHRLCTARRCLAALVAGGYPHQGLVLALDDTIDAAARIVRQAIVKRLLDDRMPASEAAKLIAALQKQIDSGWWVSAEADLEEWLAEPKKAGPPASSNVIDLWEI